MPARLKVALLSLPMRTQAVLEYFIEGAGRAAFSQSEESSADAVIFDHDIPESRAHWEVFRQQRDRPGILLAVQVHDVPGTIWVQKPVSPAALLAAAAHIARGDPVVVTPAVVAEAAIAPSALLSAPAVASEAPGSRSEAPAPQSQEPQALEPRALEPQPPAVQARPAGRAPVHDEKWAAFDLLAIQPGDEVRYCGDRADYPLAALRNDPSAFYSLKSTFLEGLMEAVLVARKWNAATRLESPEGLVTIDMQLNRAYVRCSEEALARLCDPALALSLPVRTVTSHALAQLQAEADPAVAIQRVDALLWRVALETSRGRLPAGTDPAATVYLKRWPNFTRLLQPPHALRVIALLAVRGASLDDAARTLDIPQRHVFACYNGLVALDLVTLDGTQMKRRQRRAHKNRTLFTRLFRWLRGKG